jgi:hypothetical protein
VDFLSLYGLLTPITPASNGNGFIFLIYCVQRLIDPDPKYLVKFDYTTAEPKRDKNGRCIPIKPGWSLFFIFAPEKVSFLNLY